MAERWEGPGDTVSVMPHAVLDKRQERRDAAENRKRILDAAQQLFMESGVEAVSMHQIAQAAGVGQGTLYRRYAHKGELCRDLLSESADRFIAGTEQQWAQDQRETPALERLTGLLARYLTLVETKLSLMAAIGDACWGGRRGEKFRTSGYRWMHRTIAGLLTEAMEQGELCPLDASFTADALLASLSPDVYQFQREERGLTPEQILQGVCRLFAERHTEQLPAPANLSAALTSTGSR
jgi:AcrR family transcriptional regulator